MLPQPAADELLGRALRTGGRIDVSGVDHVAAAFDVLVEDLSGGLLVRLLAEGHSPQRKLAHQHARPAQQPLPHGHPPHPSSAVNAASLAWLMATLSIGSRRGLSCSTTSHFGRASRHARRISIQSRFPSPISASTGLPRTTATSFKCTSGTRSLNRRIQVAGLAPPNWSQ